MLSISEILVGKIVLALVGLAFVWLFYFLRKDKNLRKILIAIFIPFVVFSSWAFYNFDRNIDVGYWDMYHYYLNAKYFDELGYFDLYRGSLVADSEGENHFENIIGIRNLRTQIQEQFSLDEEEAEFLREKFSTERWAEFKNDVSYFFEKISPKTLTDRGYNASPTWNKTASLIANALPLENSATIPILFSLDILIFATTILVIGNVFGILAALFFVVFWGVIPLVMVPLHFGFLRLDWLLAIVASAAFWRKEKFAASGVALAFATFLRIFPIVLLAGIIFREAFDFWKKKKISPESRKFLVGFLLAAVALFLWGSLDQSNLFDFARWDDFWEKISAHSATYSNQRSGLGYLVPDAVGILRWPIAIAVFTFFGFISRKIAKENLLPLGLILIPFATTPASYYFCFVAALVLIFHDPTKKAHALGISLILGSLILQAFATIRENVYHNSTTSYFWSLLFFILGIALLALIRGESKNRGSVF